MRVVLAATLRRLAHRLDPATTPTNVVQVHIDGESVIRAVKERNRRGGLGTAGI